MKQKSIKYKFIIIYASLIIIITSLLTFFFYNAVSNKLMTIAKDNSTEMTNLYSKRLGETLEGHISMLQLIAKNEDVISLNQNKIFNWINQINEMDSYIFTNNAYTDSNGYSHTPGYEPWYVGDRESFNMLMNTEADYFVHGPLLGEAKGLPIITVSVPIIYNYEPVGTFSGAIELDELTKQLDDVRLEQNSFAWIINNEGYIIVHPNFSFNDEMNINQLINYGYADIDVLINDLENDYSGFGEYFDHNTDTKRIVTFTSIPFTPGWKLGISTVSDDLYSGSSFVLKTIILLNIVVLVSTLIITRLLSNTITSPIYALTKAAKLSEMLDIKKIKYGNWYKEYVLLVSTYNQMTMRHLNYNRHLEKTVKERTNDLEQLNSTLYDLTIKDKLTSAFNRGKIYSEIEIFFILVQNKELNNFNIIFIDLDNFKYYNDNYGHGIGDKILIDLVKLLIKYIGNNGIVGRYGGDEFVITYQTQIIDISIILSDLNDIITKQKGYQNHIKLWMNKDIVIPEDKQVGLSMGSAVYEVDSQLTADELIRIADTNMYEHKTRRKKHRN